MSQQDVLYVALIIVIVLFGIACMATIAVAHGDSWKKREDKYYTFMPHDLYDGTEEEGDK